MKSLKIIETLRNFQRLKKNFYFQLIFGRLLVGLAGGAFTTIVPAYIGEIASKEVRGVLLTLFQSSVDLGVLTVSILGWKLELFTLNCIACVLVTIYPILFMFFPETPVFLVGKGEKEKATNSLQRLRGADHNPESEILELQTVYEEALQAPKSSFSQEIQKKSTLKAFIIIMVLFLVFQFSGINAVMFYATSIFIESGISLNPFLASIILSIIEVFATIFSASIVDRFGRVALLKASLTLAFIGSMGIGSFFVMKDFNIGFYKSVTWIPLPSLCIFVFGFSMGLATVPFILLGEVFSDEAKKIIAPLGQTTNNFLSVVIGLLFPFLVGTIGSGFTFYIFASFILFGFVFTVIYIPETKGKSLTEIQNILRS